MRAMEGTEAAIGETAGRSRAAANTLEERVMSIIRKELGQTPRVKVKDRRE